VHCRVACLMFVVASLAGCGRIDSPSVDVNPVQFNAAGAPTVAFSVPDMMCPEGCGTKVKEILLEQPGVKEVLVEFETKTATVAVDETTFDSDAAIAALVDHQFEHSTLKAEAGEP